MRLAKTTYFSTLALLKGEALKIFNGGNLERDFTYTDDVVEGIMRCVASDELSQYEILNIGRSKPEKLVDVVALLANALDVQPEYEFLPMQAGGYDLHLGRCFKGSAESRLFAQDNHR